MNSVIWSVWTMPTAALQLLATPYVSRTFAPASATARHLAPAPRGAPKEGAVRGRRRPDPTGSCDFPTVATVHVKSFMTWPQESSGVSRGVKTFKDKRAASSGVIVATDPYSKSVKLAPGTY